MNTIQKRLALFLVGCMGARFLFVYMAKQISCDYLPYLGWVALIPAIGFLTIYLSNSRKTGIEVFGDKIWWNNLRPVHALMYSLFAYSAIRKQRSAWMYLLVDAILGLVSFLTHHYFQGNFAVVASFS